MIAVFFQELVYIFWVIVFIILKWRKQEKNIWIYYSKRNKHFLHAFLSYNLLTFTVHESLAKAFKHILIVFTIVL